MHFNIYFLKNKQTNPKQTEQSQKQTKNFNPESYF